MTYKLFGLPYYESAIVEQNLLLNKRQKDEIEMKDDENGNRIPNRYVKQLVATVNVAGA
ncbi:unnamed protein product, partial [Rotaria sp. Silwood1]